LFKAVCDEGKGIPGIIDDAVLILVDP